MNYINVVVVEDEARIRRGIERLIAQCGAEWKVVGSFPDGQKAFDGILTDELSFDVLITDIKMPKKDGLQLIESLNQEQYLFLPVIISGFDDFKLLQNAIRQGAVDYLLKPINRKTFAEQLARLKDKVVEMRGQLELDKQVIYSQQIQQLGELTWCKEMDLSLLQWVKEFPKGPYSLVYISKDDFYLDKSTEDREQAELITLVEKELESVRFSEGDKRMIWWWRGDRCSFWLMYQTDESCASKQEIVYKIKEVLTSHGSFSIAVSDRFEELSLLPTIRDQLLALIQMRLVLGGNRLFSSSLNETPALKNAELTLSNDLYQMVQHLALTIERSDLVNVDKKVKRLFGTLQQQESPQVVSQVVHYFITTVYNQVISNEKLQPKSLEDILYQVKAASNFTELQTIVLNWTKEMINSHSLITDGHSPIDKVKEWIVDHLHENITISKVAEQVHMNPNYLCEVFKNETGETILDFVTRKKMIKAKQLLLQSDKKVYDIAKEVGYKDTKYFSRLFKQYMGEVPSKYRELQRSKLSETKT